MEIEPFTFYKNLIISMAIPGAACLVRHDENFCGESTTTLEWTSLTFLEGAMANFDVQFHMATTMNGPTFPPHPLNLLVNENT